MIQLDYSLQPYFFKKNGLAKQNTQSKKQKNCPPRGIPCIIHQIWNGSLKELPQPKVWEGTFFFFGDFFEGEVRVFNHREKWLEKPLGMGSTLTKNHVLFSPRNLGEMGWFNHQLDI